VADTRWKRNSRCIGRNIEGEAIVLDLKSGVYYSLNEVGTAVWDRLLDSATAGELAAEIAAEYEVSCEAALADIEELLKDLAAEGLISGEG
jgi:hypothetical protein